MGEASEMMLSGSKIPEYELVSAIYSLTPFPLPGLDKLKVKYNHEFFKTQT